jgi:multicomponent Na+:H+ antiporter subunit C
MTTVELTLWLAALLIGLGVVRLLTVEDLIARLVAINVIGAGTLLALVGLSVRTEVVDAVPQALALTGIVITVAFTGVGLILVRVLEAGPSSTGEQDDARSTGPSDEPR